MEKKLEILITQPFEEALIDKIRRVASQVEVTVQPAKTADEIPDEVWKRAEILYTSSVLPTAEQAPRLRWIQFHWAGVNALLDAPILKKEDLVVTSLSGAHLPQMGEYVLMMLLALGHRLPSLMFAQQHREWAPDRWQRYQPVELRGSTVGIVGYGSLGREIARLLQVFNVTVLATKRDVLHPEDTGYTPAGMGDPEGKYFRRLYPAKALKSMLKECDFVVVTVPLTPETEGMLGLEEFAVMKPTAFLVDVSRGKVVDNEALIKALREGKIGGAALDVFPEEPLPKDSPLWDMPNCLLTPHISGVTARYNERAVELFVTNLQRYLTSHHLYNVVDGNRGY